MDKEVARFEAALLRVREEFATLKGRLQHTSAEFGAFIDLHSMMLADPELAEVPKQLIRERRLSNREIAGWSTKPRLTTDIVPERADDGLVPAQA